MLHYADLPDMKLATAVAALLILLVASLAPSPRDAAAGTGVCPENPSPPNPADPSMFLDTPAEGSTVTSPVTVAGRARVFEANVRITIYEANGNKLVDTFTTAAEGAPALAPYSKSVPFTVATTQQGCVRVWEESAQDGSPRNVVQHEVTLSVGVTGLPSTGNGGPAAGHANATLFVLGAMAGLTLAAFEIKRRV
jgi:hypothetical protein